MQTLPLPDLSTAIERLKHWLAPLVDEAVYAKTQEAVDVFAKRDGEHLYTALLVQAQAKAPESWLMALWQRQFLLNRESLPFSNNNLTLKIDWKAPQTGLKRVAHFAIAMARVHQLYLREPEKLQEELAELGLGSEQYCLAQWEVLKGAVRRPNAQKDEVVVYEPKADEPAHIVLIYQGHAWKVQIMDGKGDLANAAQLENVLYEILQETQVEKTVPFTTPSLLPAEIALEVRAQLLCRDENAKIMQALSRAWFVLTLDNVHYLDESEAFFNAAFGQGDDYWAHKPLNYVCYLKDDRFFLHFDHSFLDAAAAVDMLALGQHLLDKSAQYPRKNKLADNLSLTPLNWMIDGRRNSAENGSKGEGSDGTYGMLYEALTLFRRQSETLMVSMYDVFMTDEEKRLLRDYSLSGVIQLLLQYAQFITYGEVRHTSQSLDMRHFYHGRSDTIATVTKDSLEAVYALAEHRLSVKQLQQAVQIHEKRVKLSQNGGGINGFWLAMRYMGEVQGVQIDLLQDEGLLTLLNPFVATIESSNHHSEGKLVFAPPQENGLAVSYNASRNYCDFVITHKRSKINEVEKFTRAIGSGLKQILLLLREQQ